jgi:hypothetical protein
VVVDPLVAWDRLVHRLTMEYQHLFCGLVRLHLH